MGPFFHPGAAPDSLKKSRPEKRALPRPIDTNHLFRKAFDRKLEYTLLLDSMGIFSKPTDEFTWTCGGSTKISHARYIKSGGAGEVHAVLFAILYVEMLTALLDDF